MIRAVIFDIGGPIDLEYAFEAAIDADIRAGLADEGFEVDDEAYREAERWAVQQFAPSLHRAVIWRLTGGDREASLRVYHAMEARSDTRGHLFQLRPGIAEVLAALHTQGLILGLAANQPAESITRLAQQGIGHYFTNPGVSGVYRFRKPDVRLFLRACSDLSVEPEECIMVGDRIDNDVAPAKLLGMRTVLIRTGRHAEQQPRSWDEVPDIEVKTTEELLPAILSLVGQEEAQRA